MNVRAGQIETQTDGQADAGRPGNEASNEQITRATHSIRHQLQVLSA